MDLLDHTLLVRCQKLPGARSIVITVIVVNCDLVRIQFICASSFRLKLESLDQSWFVLFDVSLVSDL